MRGKCLNALLSRLNASLSTTVGREEGSPELTTMLKEEVAEEAAEVKAAMDASLKEMEEDMEWTKNMEARLRLRGVTFEDLEFIRTSTRLAKAKEEQEEHYSRLKEMRDKVIDVQARLQATSPAPGIPRFAHNSNPPGGNPPVAHAEVTAEMQREERGRG